MSEDFNKVVEEGRSVLEKLVVEKPAHKAIRHALVSLRKKGRIGEIRRSSDNKDAITLPQLFNLDLLWFASLARSSGMWRHMAYHEIGELTYIAPLRYNHNLGKGEYNLSQLTASDVYGDLLASTLSPLTPEQQLELIGGKRPYDFFKEGFSKQDAEFMISQLNTLEFYETRTEDGYVYGHELKEFYQAIVDLQVGLTTPQRALFQLKMYDVVQRLVAEDLERGVVPNAENIPGMIFKPEQVVGELEKFIDYLKC